MAYKYTVQSVEQRDDVLLLTLAPTGKAMPFTPGQYAAISFKRGGRPTPARCFSIVSTPRSGVLQFAMRIRGRFTDTVAQLRRGETVYVRGAFGDFVINPQDDRRIVMFASGIGITPFLSMLRDLAERQTAVPALLLYSNRSSSQIPFETALRTLVQQSRYLQVRFFSGDTTGIITEQHIRQLTAADDGSTTYFVCGPKSFSRRLQHMLDAAGVHESRIVSESFAQGSPATIGNGWSIPRLTYSLSAAVFALAVGFIMALDLSRAVPKLVAAQPQSKTPAQAASNAPQQSDGSADDGSTDSPNATTPSTSTPAQTQTTPTQTTPAQTTTPSQSPSYYYYQPPVSQVS